MFTVHTYKKLNYEVIATPEEAYVEVTNENDDEIMEIHKESDSFSLVIYETKNMSIPVSDLEKALEFAKQEL